MKIILKLSALSIIVLSFVFISCTSNQKPEAVQAVSTENNAGPADTKKDSSEMAMVVTDFFKAFDERDLKKINDLCIPETKIIHYNGAVTNTAEIIQIIKKTKDWYPRARNLSDFEYMAEDDLAVMGFQNEVTFSLPDKKVNERYIETWIFRKIGGTWKPIRIHYSKITVDKHSEEVK